MQLGISRLPRWLRDVAPLILWMGLIFWLSSRSVLVKIDDPGNEKLFYKSSHMVAYGVLAWLWWRALTGERLTQWTLLLAAVGLTTLYGVSDEIHQRFVPGRHGQLTDVLFDMSGAVLMILLIRWVGWLRRFPENLSLVRANREGKSSSIVSSQ
ncbi:MAG: VanZ family protein [Anaerolineae bacterium]|nr:VanZ family protein [Anaerolineae bacterium]